METISLCLITKNEAHNLARCLASVQGYVDEIIVVDTGSTDSTVEIAKKIGAKVYQFPWNDDFSAARNLSLEQATGEWIFMLEAGEELAPDLAGILRNITRDPETDGYYLRVDNFSGDEGRVETCSEIVFRLFRNSRDYRFQGVIYEQITEVIKTVKPSASFKVCEDIKILRFGYLEGEIKDKNKRAGMLEIMKKEIEANPNDSLIRYHYGVELYCDEQYEEAARELLKAVQGLAPGAIYLPKLFKYLVLASYEAGKWEETVKYATQGLKFFPDFPDLYYYLGLVYYHNGNYAQAQQAFKQALVLPAPPLHYASLPGSRSYRVKYFLGQIDEDLLDDEEALCWYLQSLKDCSEYKPALEQAIKILDPVLKPQDTHQFLSKIFDFSSPKANYAAGEICFKEGGYTLALNYLSQSYPEGNYSPEMEIWLAVCHIQCSRHFEALKLLRKVSPEHYLFPLANINIFFSYWVQKNKHQVKKILAELNRISLVSGVHQVLLLLKNQLEEKNLSTKATVNPNGYGFFLSFVKRTIDVGEVGRVEQLLECLSEQTLPEVQLEVGKLYKRYHHWNLAEKAISKRMAAVEGDWESYYLLGEIAENNEDLEKAAWFFRKANELNPKALKSYVKLLGIYRRLAGESQAEVKQELLQD